MIRFTVFYGNAAEVSEVLLLVFCFFFSSIIQQNFTFTSPVFSAATEIRDHVITRLY